MGPLTIVVSPGLTGVADDHEAALSAADDLRADLLEQGLIAHDEGSDVPGTKGWEQYLTILVGGGGALGSVVALFHAWLNRDRRRFLILRKRVDGRIVAEVEIAGDTVSDETIRAALEQVVDLE
ncbi:hypothetical protein [Micromonospora sp. NPDC000442]|uniref:effector-associated constant component EACC1 n=1 Tax=Micromonospora sp. NPDC000442 TaxID=3364217 RepID=UPI003695377F